MAGVPGITGPLTGQVQEEGALQRGGCPTHARTALCTCPSTAPTHTSAVCHVRHGIAGSTVRLSPLAAALPRSALATGQSFIT